MARTETAPREYTNPVGYAQVDVAKMQPMGDRILLQWEEGNNEISAGTIKLIRPDTHKGMHYTGIVLKIGPLVDPAIKVGQRLIFDQFSDFGKYFDPKYGRLALLEESKQGSCFAIIPPRMKIGAGEGDYNYDK